MISQELKKILEQEGAYIEHFGLYVSDAEKTVEFLTQLPFIELATYIDHTRPEEKIVTGGSFHMKIALLKIVGSDIGIEVIQPLDDCAETSYMKKFMATEREGFHHISVKFKTYETFLSAYNALKEMGCIEQHHDRGLLFDGTPNEHMLEMAYMEAPEGYGGVIVEIGAHYGYKN